MLKKRFLLDMATSKISLHPIAELELWEAIDWYNAQKPDLGKSFAKEIQRLIRAIGNNPLQFPIAYSNRRKAVCVGFPYVIVFEYIEDAILILSVFHTQRNPKDLIER
jgi:plasmid stabilization system protein ParE